MAPHRARHRRVHRRRPPAAVLVPLAAAGITAAIAARRHAAREADEHASADVGYMRAMHDALRRDMDRLEAAAGDARSATRDYEPDWHEIRARLERHHSAEDDDLWPILRRHLTVADERHEVDRMIEEHQGLAIAITDVDRAFSTREAAVPAISALGRTLRDHLDHEERTVLPMLERHLSRAEWRGFLITERRKTPLRERHEFLGWVLDDANPADTEAVLSELPPPGRFVYRHIIGPRYAAKDPHRHGRRRARRAVNVAG
jgi:hemerythrin-like domain-containing protein